MDSTAQEMEISPEEREQILGQLEAAISQGRTTGRSDLSVLPAEKMGLLLPLVINLAALVLVGAGVFLLFRYFELRKESITLRHGSYLTAEGTLIRTLKQETESRILAKEEEITAIQAELQTVDQERQALKFKLAADLETRQGQLRRRLEEELSRERQRLIALGTSDVGIAERLRELENSQQITIDREIARYRNELAAELLARERDLLQSQRLAQEALEQAKQDRNQLLSELRRQESEKTAAENQLSELAARMQAEGLLKDQAAAVFQNMQENLREDRYAEALLDLEGLETNPVVESYVLSLLKELIQSGEAVSAGKVSPVGETTVGEAAAADAMAAELAAKTAEVEELQGQIRAIVTASSSDKSSGAVLAQQLQERIDSLNAQVKDLTGQLKAAAARTDKLNTDLQALRAEREANSASLRNAQSAQKAALDQGRDDALRDIMSFLNLLSGTGENSDETESRLVSLARQDPLFRAATREIQILIAGGGSAGDLAAPFLFLGIVSSVAAGTVVIEAMVDLDVSVGSVIQIRRISDLDRETTIAEGTVQQMRGGKITASFKPVASGTQGPTARDPVYLAGDGR